MRTRYKVGRPTMQEGRVIYPVIDTETEKTVRDDAVTIIEAKRIARHYNCVEVWQK